MIILGRVVVVTLMAVFLADDHVGLDRRPGLQSRDVWRDRSNVGTLAEQRFLARTACWRAGKLLDPTTRNTFQFQFQSVTDYSH